MDRTLRQPAIYAEKIAGRRVLAVIRVGAWLSVLTIIVLSIVPGHLRPHVLTNGRYEHFTAYFIAGSLFGLGYPLPKHVRLTAVMLALCGGLLEVVQLWIPDRTANVVDFEASTFGAWSALILISVARWTRAVRE